MSVPISTTSGWYRSEYVPATVSAMQVPLCAGLGVPLANFGAKGNTVHDYGPHRSYNWIINAPESRFRYEDRSVLGDLNSLNIDRNAVAAFDITPGSRAMMRVITARMYNAARRHDLRLGAMREFAGTLDGSTVVRFETNGGRIISPLDSSHLDHGHGVFWRRYAGLDHSGIVEILTGDDMTPDESQRLINIEQWLKQYFEGRSTALAGTPHLSVFVPNQRTAELVGRPAVPPVELTEAQMQAIAERTAELVLTQLELPTREERVQEAFEGAQRAEDE